MKSISVLRSSNLVRSLAFYTGVLEFQEKYPQHRKLSLGNGVMFLVCDAAELQLSTHRGDGAFGASVILELDRPSEVDELFARYTSRGLDQSHRTESPVHLAPLDQTWVRVFSVPTTPTATRFASAPGTDCTRYPSRYWGMLASRSRSQACMSSPSSSART